MQISQKELRHLLQSRRDKKCSSARARTTSVTASSGSWLRQCRDNPALKIAQAALKSQQDLCGGAQCKRSLLSGRPARVVHGRRVQLTFSRYSTVPLAVDFSSLAPVHDWTRAHESRLGTAPWWHLQRTDFPQKKSGPLFLTFSFFSSALDHHVSLLAHDCFDLLRPRKVELLGHARAHARTRARTRALSVSACVC